MMGKNININLSMETLQYLDEARNELSMTRSGFINMCIRQYAIQYEAIQKLPDYLKEMRNIKEELEKISDK